MEKRTWASGLNAVDLHVKARGARMFRFGPVRVDPSQLEPNALLRKSQLDVVRLHRIEETRA